MPLLILVKNSNSLLYLSNQKVLIKAIFVKLD